MAEVLLTKDNFEEEVMKCELPVLIDFFAVWCGPCAMLAPTIEEIADEYDDRVKVCKVDVDTAPELAEKFGDKFCIFLAWRTGIEILAKDTNKGTAVKKLREILGDKVKKVICVGDSESDSFMFDYADIGVAVENADEYAKKAADKITVNFEEGFVKYIVEDIEKGIL